MINNIEIQPPWIEYPGFPPYDTFWRQSGEIWFFYVWLPYWQSLTNDEQQAYLDRWKVPEVWCTYCVYINPAYGEWLKSLDEAE